MVSIEVPRSHTQHPLSMCRQSSSNCRPFHSPLFHLRTSKSLNSNDISYMTISKSFLSFPSQCLITHLTFCTSHLSHFPPPPTYHQTLTKKGDSGTSRIVLIPTPSNNEIVYCQISSRVLITTVP